jgi:hypothetical protein
MRLSNQLSVSLSICSPRVTQDVSTVWSGMRKESKYELEGAGEGGEEVERRVPSSQ